LGIFFYQLEQTIKWSIRMEIKDGEVECNKCYGAGIIDEDDSTVMLTCQRCSGTGKLDWISNAMVEIDKTSLLHDCTKVMSLAPNSDIIFYIHNKEYLKICDNGDFLVNGQLAKNDQAVYDGFVNFLKSTGFY